MAQADTLADRLRLEADRVTELARLEAERVELETLHTRRRKDEEEARAKRQEAEARWVAVWKPLGFEPATPKEMLVWVRQHAKLVERCENLREARASEAEQADRIARLRAEVSTLLVELGEPAADRDETLPDLLEHARDLLEHLGDVRKERRTLEHAIEQNERNLEAARLDEAEARRKLDEWKSAWAATITPLGLDPSAKPTEVDATLDRRDALVATLEKLEAHRQRIQSFENEQIRIGRETRSLADRVAPELTAEPLAGQVGGLGRLLNEAHRAESRREQLQKGRQQQEQRGREGRSQAAAARERLSDLAREAGCNDPGQLPEAEERARRQRETEARLEEVDDRLRNHSGGMPVASFLEAAQAVDPDGLPAQVERLAQQIALAEGQRRELDRQLGQERQILKDMEESAREAKAEQAAVEAQGLLARIEAEAGRYLRLRLASAVLRQAIERYRQRSQGPVLRRASTLFQELTRGSFHGLTTEYDDDATPRLVGVRPERATVPVEGMSEGTRDQLFLALKIASLEHHLDHHEPLPFIADDLLVNFDDDRAQAALQVLAELSRRTQVLFFTHHWHLVELAEAKLKPDVLFTHELRSPSVNGVPARA